MVFEDVVVLSVQNQGIEAWEYCFLKLPKVLGGQSEKARYQGTEDQRRGCGHGVGSFLMKKQHKIKQGY